MLKAAIKAIILSTILLASSSALAYTNALHYTNDQCLASAIFYEAQTEPLEGKVAVYDVILNRSEQSGKSVCQVIRERGQFSWYGHKPIRKYDKKMQQLLTQVKSQDKILENENYFFHKHLHPKWARRMKCMVIGNMKFCKGKYE